MRDLVLIRHSEPRVEPEKPAASWELSAEGRARCAGLAQDLRQFELREIVASVEPKAAQTAGLLAAELDIGWRTAPDLHEHEREALPWLDEVEWRDLLRRFFERPDELVFGRETATQALGRFSAAVARVVEDQPAGNVAIVTHGTVIALYASASSGFDAYEVWRELRMPDYRVMPLRR